MLRGSGDENTLNNVTFFLLPSVFSPIDYYFERTSTSDD